MTRTTAVIAIVGCLLSQAGAAHASDEPPLVFGVGYGFISGSTTLGEAMGSDQIHGRSGAIHGVFRKVGRGDEMVSGFDYMATVCRNGIPYAGDAKMEPQTNASGVTGSSAYCSFVMAIRGGLGPRFELPGNMLLGVQINVVAMIVQNKWDLALPYMGSQFRPGEEVYVNAFSDLYGPGLDITLAGKESARFEGELVLDWPVLGTLMAASGGPYSPALVYWPPEGLSVGGPNNATFDRVTYVGVTLTGRVRLVGGLFAYVEGHYGSVNYKNFSPDAITHGASTVQVVTDSNFKSSERWGTTGVEVHF